MSMGLAYAGEGIARGMEASRQHRRQDKQDERADELYGLKTERMRSDMAHQEMMRPMEVEGAELGLQGTRADLEHQEAMRPIEQQGAEYGLRQAERQDEQGEMQLEAAQRAEQTEKYLRRFAAGDAGALQDWYNQYGPNNIEEIGRTKDGQYHVVYDDGDEEAVGRDELGERMAAMLDPQAWIAELTAQPEPAEERWHEASDGSLYDRRSGRAISREEAGLPPLEEGGGSGNLDSATLNTLERVSRSFWGTMNEQGQFILPEGSQQNYAETLDRAEALVMQDLPPGKAANVAAMSLAGPMNEEDARRKATNEAREEGIKTPGMFSGGDSEWLDQRTQEIMQESREAEQIYNEAVGGQRRRGLDPESVGGQSRERSGAGRQGNAGAVDRGAERPPQQGGQGAERPPAQSDRGRAQAAYVTPSGNHYTQADIEDTARKHGLTVEQVIERANLRPADN